MIRKALNSILKRVRGDSKKPSHEARLSFVARDKDKEVRGLDAPDELLAQATCAVLSDGEAVATAWLVSQEGHLITAGHVLGNESPLPEVEV